MQLNACFEMLHPFYIVSIVQLCFSIYNCQESTGEMKARTQMQEEGLFNNEIKQREAKTTPKGKNRQAENCVHTT